MGVAGASATTSFEDQALRFVVCAGLTALFLFFFILGARG